MILKLLKKSNQYESFWKWFVKQESNINMNFESNKEGFMDELSSRLKGIDNNLTFEISHTQEEKKRELVISADGIADSFQHVINLCDAAPEFLNWIIIAFRPRMNSDEIEIKMGDISLSYQDVHFRFIDNGHYIDLDIYIEDLESNRDQFINMYFILLDSLIGEYDAVSKIGNTNLFDRNSYNETELRRFIELIEIIDALE